MNQSKTKNFKNEILNVSYGTLGMALDTHTYEDTISNTRQWCLMDSDAEHPIASRRPGILRLSESVIKRVIG